MTAELLAANGYRNSGEIINVAEINRIVANTFKERSYAITLGKGSTAKNASFVEYLVLMLLVKMVR